MWRTHMTSVRAYVRALRPPIVLLLPLLALLYHPSVGAGAGPQLQYLDPALQSSFVVASDSLQCSLLDTTTHNDASILGQDGGWSFSQNGNVYWNYGDTFLEYGAAVRNSLGITAASDSPHAPNASGAASTPCFSNTTYKTAGGVVAAMLPPDAPGCVDWPTQDVATSPGSTTLYFTYARWAESPSCTTAGVGIGMLDTTTLNTWRINDPPAWRAVPGQPVEVLGAAPLLANDGDGSFVYVFMVVSGNVSDVLQSTTSIALARVAPASVGTPSAYRYWSGSSWVTWDTFTAIPVNDNGHLLWRQASFGIQAGLKVSYVARLQKWVATYATGLATDIRIRTADHLTGPWSDESRIVDCVAQLTALPATIDGNNIPCYSAQLHDEFTSADGLTAFISFARNNWPGDYRGYLRKFQLASPISEWLAPDGRRMLAAAAPVAGAQQLGLAFFASEIPITGFVAVHAFDAAPPLPADRMYSTSSTPPAGYVHSGITFYAPAGGASASLNTEFAPVHAVLLGSGVHAYTLGPVPAGATDQGVAFSAIIPNPDVDGDGIANAVDNCPFDPVPDQTDTDGDHVGDDCDPDDDNDNIGDYRFDPTYFLLDNDNCPKQFNPDQTDTDRDGHGDACDPDDDNDGLADTVETNTGVFVSPSDTGTNPLVVDSDDDGCADGTELGASPAAGGRRDPNDPWDFYDVPAPALRLGYTGQARDGGISLGQDVLALLRYSGLSSTAPAYSADVDGNGVADGLQYDRRLSTVPGEPWRSGPPDGAIGLGSDVLAMLAQVGTTCA